LGRHTIQENRYEDIVQLISEVDVGVGLDVIDDNITCEMELHHVKLWPYEVAMHMLQVVDDTIWT